MKSTDKGLSIKSLISPIQDQLIELGEKHLDVIIFALSDSEAFKEIDGIRSIIAVKNFTSAIQTAFFIKKYGAFIGVISRDISPEERIKLIGEMDKNPKLADKITEQTIIALDRYQNEVKAALLGQLFVKTFKEHVFSIKEYNKLLFSIELMHPVNGLECLKAYYEYRIDFEAEKDKNRRNKIWKAGAILDYSSISTSGFLTLPSGYGGAGDFGGARLNDLGLKFYEEVYLPIEGKINVY